MDDLQTEDCPVCWRGFSEDLHPFIINCGHSFCDECSSGLRTCPLCRARLPRDNPRTKNFSLISLLERIRSRPQQIDKKHQEIQTDNSFLSKRIVKYAKKTEQQEISENLSKPFGLKFHKDAQGNIRRFEIKFK
jgi:hypothetical protein